MKQILILLALITFVFSDEEIINSSEEYAENVENSPPTIEKHRYKRSKITQILKKDILEVRNTTYVQYKINDKDLREKK